MLSALAPALASAQQAGERASGSALPDPPPRAPEDGPNWFALPALAYTPETSLVFAAAGVITSRDSEVAEPFESFATASLFYTIRHQWGVGVDASLFLDHDHILIEFLSTTLSWKDFYFGVGDDPVVDGVPFETFEGALEVAASHRIFTRPLYAGVMLRAIGVDLRSSESEELTSLRGGRGGKNVGLGVQLLWDSRDRTFWTQRGAYAKLVSIGYTDHVISDYSFVSTDLDARTFHLLPYDFVLAGQFAAQVRAGDVPFFHHARIGGTLKMRGTYQGRYRDEVGAYTQLELRTPYWWRVALVGFGAVGFVSPSIAELPLTDPVPAGGAGLRVRVADGGVNLRLDAGFAPDEVGFYFALGEAF